MIQLTYISTATSRMTDADVDLILARSRVNNVDRNVTGMLVYNGRRFLQTLEGAAEDVSEIYRRISADRRHHALVLLSSAESTNRVFGAWAMAGLRVTGDTESARFVEQVEALTADITDRSVQAHFRSFAAIQPVL